MTHNITTYYPTHTPTLSKGRVPVLLAGAALAASFLYVRAKTRIARAVGAMPLMQALRLAHSDAIRA